MKITESNNIFLIFDLFNKNINNENGVSEKRHVTPSPVSSPILACGRSDDRTADKTRLGQILTF